jgi:2-polyprenyl-3-methyl-5-hydroxy-6-metoxy-1,4-benzoquinol methylase
MAVILDPEENEIKALLQYADDFMGKNILEVGCGDGRLTWRYAHMAETVTGLEPDHDRITQAIESIPADLHGKVYLHPLSLEDYFNQKKNSPKAGSHDLALLSWSL